MRLLSPNAFASSAISPSGVEMQEPVTIKVRPGLPARARSTSTFNICWGAQAALYHRYRVPKHLLPRKLSGIFEHRVVKRGSEILRGFTDSFPVPVSRYTETRARDIVKHPELEILAESDEAGICLIQDRAARAITRDDREAEDVVQQAYVNAYTHLRQFKAEAQFGTWLTRIAVNEALARVRRRGRYEPFDEEQSNVETFMTFNPAPNPEQQAVTDELRGLLEWAIDTLPDGARETFVLRDGPERIESGWWDGGDVRRDYYVADTPDGATVWIYRDHRYGVDDGEWFLHGLFG